VTPPRGPVLPVSGHERGPELCAMIAGLLEDAPGRVVVCDVAALRDPTVATVGTLLRVQLAARRRGGRIELGHPGEALLTLIERMGLTAVLPPSALRSRRAVGDGP
jgi:STAS domain